MERVDIGIIMIQTFKWIPIICVYITISYEYCMTRFIVVLISENYCTTIITGPWRKEGREFHPRPKTEKKKLYIYTHTRVVLVNILNIKTQWKRFLIKEISAFRTKPSRGLAVAAAMAVVPAAEGTRYTLITFIAFHTRRKKKKK